MYTDYNLQQILVQSSTMRETRRDLVKQRFSHMEFFIKFTKLIHI